MELQELHRAVAEVLLQGLREAPDCEASGRSGVEAALLRVASAFLRDNQITVDGAALSDLRQSMSELTDLSV
ncbi:hypothetical protein ACXYTC_24245, partial [Escherichia coli]